MPGLKDHINDRYQQGRGSYGSQDLSNAENTSSAYTSAGIDQAEAFANDPANHTQPSDAVREAESNTPNWTLDRSSFADNKGISKPSRAINIIKKGGPAGGLIGGTLAIGMGLSSLSAPALLLTHIKENFMNNFDNGSTTMDIRSKKIINKRLTTETTSGVCTDFVKVACRYERPSNHFLKALEKDSNIMAVDADGNPVKRDGLFPNKKPVAYIANDIEGPDGKKPWRIPANDFNKAIKDNPGLRSAFRKAHNPRWITHVDKTFHSFLKKFGVNKANKLADVNNEEDGKKKIASESKGKDTGADDAKKSGDKSIMRKLVKKLVGEEGAKIIGKLGKVGKSGNLFGAAMGGVCIAADAPGIIAKTIRAFQMVQLIKYAMVFLPLVDALKAGEVTPEAVTAFGTMLTAVYMVDGTPGASAMDSFGMKYGLFGDTSTKGFKSDYTKFSPGGNFIKKYGSMLKFTDSKMRKDACDAATHPATGAAINATLLATGGATLGIDWVLLGVNTLGGWAIGIVLNTFAGDIMDFVMGFVPDGILDGILEYFMGDFTANVKGEDTGNLTASSITHALSQADSAGANIPMTVGSAVAFNNVRKEVILAYAQEERATRSPFDISSPYTALGSIYTYLMPQIVSSRSPLGAIRSLGSISSGIFKSFFRPSLAFAADGAQYEMCDDPYVKEAQIAAGPFCNIAYGIPPKYLGIEPTQVVAEMKDEIDENTGEAKPDSDYALWLQQCTDGSIDAAAGCMSDSNNGRDDRKAAIFALYTIDQRAMNGMDADPMVSSGSSASTVSSGLPSGTAQELAKKLVDSGKVTCGGAQCPDFENTANGINLSQASGGSCAATELDVKLLGVMVKMVEAGHSYAMSSVCTGRGDGDHGNGKAIDIVSIDGQPYPNEGGGYWSGSTFVDTGGVTWSGAHDDASFKHLKDWTTVLPLNNLWVGQRQCHRPYDFLEAATDASDAHYGKDGCHHQHISVGRS